MQLNKIDTTEACNDELFDEAVRIVLESKRGSVSLLQRKLSIGYARASRMIEAMAASGILGEYKGSQAREVMMTLDEYENARVQMEADRRAGFTDMQDEQDDNPEDHDPPPHQVKEIEYDYNPADQQRIINS
jgi:S-DNA-T family DNA segregation ATPase FtsK/SpoIIIE